MSPEDFKKARTSLGLTQRQLGVRMNETKARIGYTEKHARKVPPDLIAKMRNLTAGEQSK